MAEDDAYLAQDNGGALVATAVSFLALTYISVGLRTYVRTYLTGGFLVDDWLMLAAQVRKPCKRGSRRVGTKDFVLTMVTGRFYHLLYIHIAWDQNRPGKTRQGAAPDRGNSSNDGEP